jgi:DNA-binding MarR family transcriptional regulator
MLETSKDLVTVPMLLRAARRTYAAAIREALISAGLGDLPLNGPFVIRAIEYSHEPLSDIARDLSVTKQAASKLIDLLVVRGFVQRKPDSTDRRRMNLELTERGHEAAEVVERATDRVDADLAAALSRTQLAGFHAALNVLLDLSDHYQGGSSA